MKYSYWWSCVMSLFLCSVKDCSVKVFVFCERLFSQSWLAEKSLGSDFRGRGSIHGSSQWICQRKFIKSFRSEGFMILDNESVKAFVKSDGSEKNERLKKEFNSYKLQNFRCETWSEISLTRKIFPIRRSFPRRIE